MRSAPAPSRTPHVGSYNLRTVPLGHVAGYNHPGVVCRLLFRGRCEFGLVVKDIALKWEALGLFPESVKSDTTTATARHRCDVSSELCCPGAKLRRWAPPLVNTLWWNTASIIKIWFWFGVEGCDNAWTSSMPSQHMELVKWLAH